jgi:hypothetical protein
MGAIEALTEGLKEAALAFGRGLGQVTDAAYSHGSQQFVEHGAHELASALFNGNGGNSFVMYPRQTLAHEDPQIEPSHGVGQEGIQPPEQTLSMEL